MKILKFTLLIFAINFSLLANNNNEPSYETAPSPEVIEKQLEDAEALFQQASEMFNPWYAGPLLTGSAHVLKPGLFNLQSYLFVTTQYGQYDNQRNTINTPNFIQLNVPIILQAGILDWMDASVTVQGFYNQTQGRESVNLGDTSVSVGIGLVKEGAFMPAFLIQLSESFPTGKFNKLDSEKFGSDSTGSGSYETAIGLNFTKVIWWWLLEHPMSFRASFSYKIPSTVNVRGFHAYGGGFGTNGKIRPGNIINANIGYEFSFTQRWVIATDIAYTAQDKTTFSGTPGTTSTGIAATNSSPSSDQLSLAPAIEYNPNSNTGLIAGVWFTVYGRNSSEFVSAIVTATHTF